MISSASFNNSDAKTNFPSDSGEPETDDFAALLDGMSFVVPTIVQQPVNTPTSFSPENNSESSIDLQTTDLPQTTENFSEGATQHLQQFDDSMITSETFAQVIPKELTSSAPENLLAKVTNTAENFAEIQPKIATGNVSATPKSFDVKPEIPTVKTGVQPDIETETPQIAPEIQTNVQAEQPTPVQTAFTAQTLPNQFAAPKILSAAANKNSAKKDSQVVENTTERNNLINPAKNLFEQIENVQTTNNSDENINSNFKITENQFRPEMLNVNEKGGAPNKLPKLFREVSSFFEVSDLAAKNQPQTVENAAPVPTEGANVAAQIEPQVVQMIAMAVKTEKPQILKMRLNPAELGVVEIKIEKDESGKINAHFHIEKEETRKILTENIAQLRDSLQDSGWQVERVEVSCDSFSFGGSDARENSSQAEKDAARNSFVNTSDSGGSIETKEDLNSEKSDRLLSVRA